MNTPTQPLQQEREKPEVKSMWLNITNVCDRGKFKVSLEVNCVEWQTFFHSYTSQNHGVISESYNLTPWLIHERKRTEEIVEVMREALEMGAFHHSECPSNWYDDNSMKPDWNGYGDHRLPKSCACARMKVTEALAKYEAWKAGDK